MLEELQNVIENSRSIGKIDIHKRTYIQDRSLFWLGTGSYKLAGLNKFYGGSRKFLFKYIILRHFVIQTIKTAKVKKKIMRKTID